MTPLHDPVADQWEIRQLIERYAVAADQVDGAAAAALFTGGGVLEHGLDPGRSDPTGTVRGPAEIAAAINRLASYRATHHTIASTVIDVEGDLAGADTRCVAHHVQGRDGGPPRDQVLYIRYLDQLERVDARWRFSRRELRVQWTSIQPVESI